MMLSAPNTLVAICATTVISEDGVTWQSIASRHTPPKMTSTTIPSRFKVALACWRAGAAKFGTLLLMASTPVSAEHPEENALNTRNSVRSPVVWERAAAC